MYDDDASLLDREDEEIASKAAKDSDSFFSLFPHFYRGEVSRTVGAQNRMDQTTNWAITFLAALLSVVFARPSVPAYLLLVGIVALSSFLAYEVRRYRFFDHYRARVHFMQENVFANMLDPIGTEHDAWREGLSDDLRQPTFKITSREALSRRLHRIYGLLFAIIGLAWVVKVTVFTPESQWTEAAALPGVPGSAVAIALAVFYLCVIALAKSPGERHAMGEICDTKPGEWNGK